MNTPLANHNPRALACSGCGGALVATDDPDRMHCQHCGTDHLLHQRGDVTAVAPQGRVSARRAHHALLAALRAQGIAGANVHERQLAWLPFWHVRAKLVGWQVYQQIVQSAHARPASSGIAGDDLGVEATRDRQRVEELVARDLDVSVPACDTRGWGLIGITDRIETMRLRPFSSEREGRQAKVCSVVVTQRAAERRAEQLRSSGLVPSGAVGIRQRLSLVRVRTRLVYYPVWKLRYTIGGEHGEADVDGIRAKVLRGDAPGAGRSVAPQWVAAASAAGWLVGVHPALGALGLAAFVAERAGHGGPGGDLARWARWLGRELEPRPIVRVPIEG